MMNNNILSMLTKQPVEVVYNMLLNTNPQLRQTIMQWQNMAKSNNLTPEQFAKQLLKQQGVSETDLNAVLSKFK